MNVEYLTEMNIEGLRAVKNGDSFLYSLWLKSILNLKF